MCSKRLRESRSAVSFLFSSSKWRIWTSHLAHSTRAVSNSFCKAWLLLPALSCASNICCWFATRALGWSWDDLGMIHSTKPEPKQIWANFMNSLNFHRMGLRQWIFHQVGVMIRVMCQDAFMVASLSFSWFSVFCSCLFSSPSVTRLDSSVDAISDESSSSVWRGWSLMFGIVWHRLWLINP